MELEAAVSAGLLELLNITSLDHAWTTEWPILIHPVLFSVLSSIIFVALETENQYSFKEAILVIGGSEARPQYLQ